MHLRFLLFLLAIQVQLIAQKPSASIDVTKYEFEVTLSDSSDIVQGHATIHFKTLSAVKTIFLDLTNKGSDGKGMTVQGVMENNSLAFTHAADSLRIQFDQTLSPGTEKKIEIYYTGIPRDGLIIGKNRYKHRGFFADHWPDRARNWLPCIDHLADKAAVNFIVNAPDHFQVIANGIMTEETNLGKGMKRTRYEENVPLPTKVMVIGVADFAVQLSGFVDCTPIYSWIYPEDRDKGFYDYSLAGSIVKFFQDRIGPYGYKKLANVQSKTRFGGLENANTIFYSESSVTGDRRSESLLAHEIAHQWFGNMATEKEWAHIWLSEGFATYMTNYYLESIYGRDTLVSLLKKQREEVIAYSNQSVQPVVDSSVTNLMQLLNTNSYQKGGWVLHMLRMQLGDSTFFKGIRNYYAKYAGKNANTEDLQAELEAVSGANLSVFFGQWLYKGGQPDLLLKWEYNKNIKTARFTIIQQQEQLFEFPLEISIQGGSEDGRLMKSLRIKQKETSFLLPMMEAPRKMELDPQVKLLFRGKIVKEGS